VAVRCGASVLPRSSPWAVRFSSGRGLALVGHGACASAWALFQSGCPHPDNTSTCSSYPLNPSLNLLHLYEHRRHACFPARHLSSTPGHTVASYSLCWLARGASQWGTGAFGSRRSVVPVLDNCTTATTRPALVRPRCLLRPRPAGPCCTPFLAEGAKGGGIVEVQQHTNMISRGIAACPIAVELAIATEKATANIIEPATPAIGAVWTGGRSFLPDHGWAC
jgi:hypothetical protein